MFARPIDDAFFFERHLAIYDWGLFLEITSVMRLFLILDLLRRQQSFLLLHTRLTRYYTTSPRAYGFFRNEPSRRLGRHDPTLV